MEDLLCPHEWIEQSKGKERLKFLFLSVSKSAEKQFQKKFRFPCLMFSTQNRGRWNLIEILVKYGKDLYLFSDFFQAHDGL